MNCQHGFFGWLDWMPKEAWECVEMLEWKVAEWIPGRSAAVLPLMGALKLVTQSPAEVHSL